MQRAIMLTLAFCLTGAVTAAPVISSARISNAWIRAMPENLPAGGYFTLANTGSKPMTLVAARSPACGSVMLHMSHKMGGVAHMMPVDKIDVQPGEQFEFKPGAYHLMCMEPKGLKPGTSVAVTLTFADGSTANTEFAVKTATGN